jgi:hypothetical protein
MAEGKIIEHNGIERGDWAGSEGRGGMGKSRRRRRGAEVGATQGGSIQRAYFGFGQRGLAGQVCNEIREFTCR